MGKISHRYDNSSNMIFIDISGVIGGREINEYLVKLAAEYKTKKELYILSDYSTGSIETNPNYYLRNLNAVKETFIKHFAPFQKFCNAYVFDTATNSSTKVLLDQFRKLTSNIKSFHSEYFDSQEDAIVWLTKMQGV